MWYFQQLNFCKTTTEFQDFIKSAKTLIGRIKKQGGSINHMKLFNCPEERVIKFGIFSDFILHKLL